MSIRKDKAPRRRRTPEESRRNILDAAETLLVEKGPQSIRLVDVGKTAGISHATVLHHFGSIDGLHAALMERMIADLVDNILKVDVSSSDEMIGQGEGLATLFDAFEQRGAARLAAWLELTGEASRLGSVREAVEKVVQEKMIAIGVPAELAEDIVLLSVTLAIGTGLFGGALGELIDKPRGRARELVLQLLMTNLAQLMEALQGKET